jgi:DNA polymerase-4
VKLRFDDFRIATRDLTLPGHTLDAREIRRAAGNCLKRVDLTRRLRLIGVRASALARLADLVAPLAAEPAAAVVPAREPDGRYHGLPLFDDAS